MNRIESLSPCTPGENSTWLLNTASKPIIMLYIVRLTSSEPHSNLISIHTRVLTWSECALSHAMPEASTSLKQNLIYWTVWDTLNRNSHFQQTTIECFLLPECNSWCVHLVYTYNGSQMLHAPNWYMQPASLKHICPHLWTHTCFFVFVPRLTARSS